MPHYPNRFSLPVGVRDRAGSGASFAARRADAGFSLSDIA